MAEGDHLTSIKVGSDADLEISCTPCWEDEIRKEAVKYCPNCKEYLCKTCTRYHGKQTLLRSHKLVNKEEAKQYSEAEMTTKCRYHPDREIEMYCQTHDMVYCSMCIATQHRSCNGVNNIEDLQADAIEQDEMQRLQREVQNIREDFQDISKEKQENIDSLKENKYKITGQLEETEKDIVEHIRKLMSKATLVLSKNVTEITKELESDIIMVTKMKKSLETARNPVQPVFSLDARQMFIHLKLIHKTITEAYEIRDAQYAKGTKIVSFSKNTEVEDSVMSATCIGQIHTTTTNTRKPKERRYRIKSMKLINVKMQNDNLTCRISDICQLQDGTILLTDQNNSKIKRLDVSYDIKDHYDLDVSPMGICCTDQNEVAVKLSDSSVHFYSVRSSLIKLKEISIEDGSYLGIAYCAGVLWVSTGSGVSVYSTSGTRQKYICKDTVGQKIFKYYPLQIAVGGENIIVTDDSDGAVSLGRNGSVIREMRDKRLVNTSGVCVSGNETVFLCGYTSNNIVIFDDNGKYLGELIAKCLTKPGSLCYDEANNCMFVTCLKNSDYIRRLEICY